MRARRVGVRRRRGLRGRLGRGRRGGMRGSELFRCGVPLRIGTLRAARLVVRRGAGLSGRGGRARLSGRDRETEHLRADLLPLPVSCVRTSSYTI